ncbi:unnamed protein product [Haemonchus placei]|uniref:Lipocalin n=1 Tax=Haemonchus placei TaxID=6290 RepID=A0A0N4W796_HAEPC|nr:unnamed protein product [Haemonchus placei]
MKELLILVSVFALSHKCNYPATGSETLQNAVPIRNFHTSGLDFVRPSWCITHCKDRKSIKAAMDFQTKGQRTDDDGERLRDFIRFRRSTRILSGLNHSDFCADPDVAAIADQVFQQYHTVSSIAEALNYMVNKTGWAYLVYEKKRIPLMFSHRSTWANIYQVFITDPCPCDECATCH